MTNATAVEPLVSTAALDALRARLASGESIKLVDITKAVATPEVVSVPDNIPLPAQITIEQANAVARLHEVYGKVQPQEVRKLEPTEVNDLMEERLVLDEVESIAKVRKESIRTAVLNHIDSVIPESDGEGRNKEGHLLVQARVHPSDHDKDFSWEVSNRGGTLDETALRALDASGAISHEDYLAMTDQVRVVNESKVLDMLRKKPELLDRIGEAVSPTSKVGSLYIRKKK